MDSMSDQGSFLQAISSAVQDAVGHKWMALAVVLATYLPAILQGKSAFPISVPASWNENRWKPVVVIVVCEAAAVVLAVSYGETWQHAVFVGLKASIWTMGLWAVVVKAIFKDHPPKWLEAIAFVFTPPVPKATLDSQPPAALPPTEIPRTLPKK
jgi:hypothetical protein